MGMSWNSDYMHGVDSSRAVFLLEHGRHTDIKIHKFTDATEHHYHHETAIAGVSCRLL